MLNQHSTAAALSEHYWTIIFQEPFPLSQPHTYLSSYVGQVQHIPRNSTLFNCNHKKETLNEKQNTMLTMCHHSSYHNSLNGYLRVHSIQVAIPISCLLIIKPLRLNQILSPSVSVRH